MDAIHNDVNDANRHKTKTLVSIDSPKVEDHIDAEDYSESNSLLLPTKKGGMSRKPEKKTRRKVQWNDKNGNKLAEILEFEPSDVSDSDSDGEDEDEDEDSDSCMCIIM